MTVAEYQLPVTSGGTACPKFVPANDGQSKIELQQMNEMRRNKSHIKDPNAGIQKTKGYY